MCVGCFDLSVLYMIKYKTVTVTNQGQAPKTKRKSLCL